MSQQELRIATIETPATDVRSITLVDPAGVELPSWAPGAHLDVSMPDGLVRQYSLCGDRDTRTEYRIAVLRTPDSRGGSAYMHDGLQVGDTLKVIGPRNHFPLLDAPRYLFIAGGIGITPILPMVAAISRGAAPWRLIYGGRNRSSMSFADQLQSYGDAGQVTLVPQDVDGLPKLLRVISTAEPDTAVYCCGPAPLLEAVETYCDRYLPPGALHLERFDNLSSIHTGVTEDLDPVEFEVELARTGQVLTVPKDRTLLSVIRDVRSDILSSCEEGYCGTCETKVLAGIPEHHDEVLSAEDRAAGNTMMICVGRCRGSRLVLDL